MGVINSKRPSYSPLFTEILLREMLCSDFAFESDFLAESLYASIICSIDHAEGSAMSADVAVGIVTPFSSL